MDAFVDLLFYGWFGGLFLLMALSLIKLIWQ